MSGPTTDPPVPGAGVATRTGPRIAFYVPANLNVIDGSAIWVATVCATLLVDPGAVVTLPMRVAERRDVVTSALRALGRVDLVPPPADADPARGASNAQVLDGLEAMDREAPFDVVLLRSYDLCLEAIERPRFRGRLLSCYVLEPERDTTDPRYLADLARIADASRYVVCQSEEMRSLFESLVPAATGRTILLPPAIPGATAVPLPDPTRVTHRLLYTGKFHPFYPVGLMVEFLRELRREIPDLEFHVAGDKIRRTPADPDYATNLERDLSTTPGVVWHGGMTRQAVEQLLASGGVALSLWDHHHGSEMNDLVISTKLLDYCSVGLPVILNRTVAQEAMLGADYPLFVARPDEALGLLRRVLSDSSLYEAAARRTWAASRRFTYEAVHERLRPFLDPSVPEATRDALQFDRPKLPGAAWNVGWIGGRADRESLRATLALLGDLRALDDRFRLLVRLADARGGVAAPDPIGGALEGIDPAMAAAVEIDPSGPDGLAWWLRKVGHAVLGASAGPALERGVAASVTNRLDPGDRDAAAGTMLRAVGIARTGRPSDAGADRP